MYCIMKGDQYLTGDLKEGRYKFTTNQYLRYSFEDKARAQVIADMEGAQVVKEFQELKEFMREKNEDPIPCPYCHKKIGINEGTSVAGDEGTFFYCPYCGEASLLIYKGARFIKSSVNPLFPVKVVYEIAGEIDYKNLNAIIPCIEIRKINASPLNTINKNYYQYFTRQEIRHFMSLEFREDL